MGFGASAQKKQSSSDTFQQQNQDRTTNTTGTSNTQSSSVQDQILQALQQMQQSSTQKQTGSTSATFGGQGQTILNQLVGTGGDVSGYGKQAADTYGDMTRSGPNPYTEEIIKNEDAVARGNFAGDLAKTRAGAYRGGTAANLAKQGNLAASFESQRSADNNRLRQGAYNDQQTLRLGGASGLAGLNSQQQGLGANLLSLLRGSSSTGETAGSTTGTTSTDQRGTTNSSGTQNTQSAQQVIDSLIALLTGHNSGTETGSQGGFKFGNF